MQIKKEITKLDSAELAAVSGGQGSTTVTVVATASGLPTASEPTASITGTVVTSTAAPPTADISTNVTPTGSVLLSVTSTPTP